MPTSCQPNIVWISLESIRADHTSLHNHHRQTTPELERIADTDTGLNFEYCFSHGTFTASSSASMLTGTYPSNHGVGLVNERIPVNLNTIAELLSSAGYQTVAINSNPQLGPERGMDRGFDDYTFFQPKTILRDLGPRAFFKYIFNIRSRGGGLSLQQTYHGAAYMMTSAIKQRIGSIADSTSPLFLYTHYPDSHHPYTPPLPYLKEMTDGMNISAKEARKLSIKTSDTLYETIANGCNLSHRELDALRAAYNGEIKHIDQCIGEVFDFVNALDSDRDTVFVIVSDHGELFGKEGLLAHKFLVHDELTHVPMVTHGIENIDHQTDEIVQPIDITRTLLSQIGVDTSQLQGIDLREETRDVAVSERGGENGQKQLDRLQCINSDFDTSIFHQTTVRSLRDHEYRYLRSRDRQELFIANNEEENVAEEYPKVVEEYECKLLNWENEFANLAGESKEEVSENMKDRLEDLGYIA